MEDKEMESRLRSALSVKRYIHTRGVVENAVALAGIHAPEKLEKARIAALLHDCAKDYPRELTHRLIHEYHLNKRNLPEDGFLPIAHAPVGAEVARREYEVTDDEVLDAIRYHTTGRPNMGIIEKILYISDFTDKNRKPFADRAIAWEKAQSSIDDALLFIIKSKVSYVKEKGAFLHPLSEEALEYYENGG